MCGILELASSTPETSAILLLPSEVMDLVIDQLREDEATLRVCSLVCQGWLPRARHHLFSILDLGNPARLASAQHLLQSPLCTIYPHVRGLCTDPSNIAPMITLIQEVNARSTLLLLKMETVIAAGLTSVDNDLQGTLLTLKNLRYLKLQFFRFGSPEDRIRLFASLPALETLVIYGVESYNDSYSEDSQNSLMYAVSPPENLHHISISAVDMPYELRWLAAHCRHSLTTLHLHDITLEWFPIVLNYLRQSSQLQCLSFDFLRWNIHERIQCQCLDAPSVSLGR
ncbi:hypothetical protein BD779DRAFT_114066 [Infundibulicybe gibba]|nr:hypothetical protein BD779DRAFT_114066 [Infundibulicybe gibba]